MSDRPKEKLFHRKSLFCALYSMQSRQPVPHDAFICGKSAIILKGAVTLEGRLTMYRQFIYTPP